MPEPGYCRTSHSTRGCTISQRRRLWLLLWLSCSCLAAFGQYYRKVQLDSTRVPLDTTPWQLVFCDEFNGQALDTTRWITYFPYDAQGGDRCLYCRTHGEEGQVYLDENVEVHDGMAYLHIAEDSVEWMGAIRAYSSGMLHTRAPWKFKYGRFETRCRLPAGKGFWPAFWLYGWGGNEIDIFELGMQDPSLHYSNVHKDINQRHYFHGGEHPGADYAADFHVFALEWEPASIRWLVDGRVVREMAYLSYRRKKQPVPPGSTLPPGKYVENGLLPDWPLDVILNVAVGVDGITPFTGSPDANTVWPAAMAIDYVRVYQRQVSDGMRPLCEEAAIIGPTQLDTPAWYRFQGPFSRLEWKWSDGLIVLDQSDDGILLAPAAGAPPSVQWVEALVDKQRSGPCPPGIFRLSMHVLK